MKKKLTCVQSFDLVLQNFQRKFWVRTHRTVDCFAHPIGETRRRNETSHVRFRRCNTTHTVSVFDLRSFSHIFCCLKSPRWSCRRQWPSVRAVHVYGVLVLSSTENRNARTRDVSASFSPRIAILPLSGFGRRFKFKTILRKRTYKTLRGRCAFDF